VPNLSDQVKNAVDGLERESKNFYEFIGGLNIFMRRLYEKDVIDSYNLIISLSLHSIPEVDISYLSPDGKTFDGTFMYTGSTNV
jgi:hypothetical protein